MLATLRFSVVPWTGCHVATASPPCPWSRASSRDGLEVFAGVCFLETMLWARRAAPLALLMECVDALPVHPHYPIILAFIRWAGFTVHTTMLHNHAVFGPCTRRRWLAVLIRHDVDLPPSRPVGLFQDPSPVPWTHESFQVQEAPEMDHARLLDAATLPYYTNPAYLAGAGLESSHDVLLSRIPSPDAPLRTLCARYSQQHLLAADTLADRGLFAQLTHLDERPAFLSPAQWALWLGATRPLVLLPPLEDVFAGLGNSISVPQAAIPWAIMLSLFGLAPHEPEHLVLQV